MGKQIPVLLIEENEHLRELIRSNLEQDGFKVYTAENGPAGIEAVGKLKLRLIILDMPEQLEQVVSALKHDLDTTHIPVFILTEADTDESQKRASEVGADSYITKPITEENLGKIIRVKLENSEAAIKKAQKKAKHVKRIPILLIDDDDIVRELVKHWLHVDDFEVYTAADGLSGIQAARKYKPRLILLDVMMPVMDGLEVLQNLKHNKKTKHIPVFMLTAKSLVGDIERAFARKADDYITKPFAGKELGKIIKAKLEKLKKQTVPA